MGAPEGNRNRATEAVDRDVVVRFRCTPDERDRINDYAANRRITVSDMLRKWLREKKVLPGPVHL